jgi:N-acetylmuramoyl-L-alanine amidase
LLGVRNNNPNQESMFKSFESASEKQQALKDVGYDPGTIDGAWGPHSMQALKSFQKDNGLKDDGVWSQEVEARLLAALK